jgi:hypothetical protein
VLGSELSLILGSDSSMNCEVYLWPIPFLPFFAENNSFGLKEQPFNSLQIKARTRY